MNFIKRKKKIMNMIGQAILKYLYVIIFIIVTLILVFGFNSSIVSVLTALIIVFLFFLFFLFFGKLRF